MMVMALGSIWVLLRALGLQDTRVTITGARLGSVQGFSYTGSRTGASTIGFYTDSFKDFRTSIRIPLWLL